METLQILFIVVPVVILIAALAIFFPVKRDNELTINVNIDSQEQEEEVVADQPVAKPKRRYKKRKKKAVVAAAPVAEVVPAVKKKVGRSKKTN